METKTIHALIVLFLFSLANIGSASEATDSIPCTIVANDSGVVYGAQCFFSKATDALTSAVLVYRGDKMPAWAKSFIYSDPTRFSVIVPKDDESGHYRGRHSSFHAVPGEVVLYRYEDDSFESIGKIERGGGWDKERGQIKALLDKLVAEAK